MRVVTLNVHKWKTADHNPNAQLVAALLQQLDADVIVLNEVLHPVRQGNTSILAGLANQLGMAFAFGAREPKQQSGASAEGGSGDALLSRFPIRSSAWGQFSSRPDKSQRGFLEARLDLGKGGTCHVVALHLDHTNEEVRLGQFEDLVAWFERDGTAPDLLVGDLNCVHPADYRDRPEVLIRLADHPVAGHLANQPDGPQLTSRFEQAGYIDVVLQTAGPGLGTFIPASDPARLDYIWLRQGSQLHPTGARIADEPPGQEASDHRAVVADFA